MICYEFQKIEIDYAKKTIFDRKSTTPDSSVKKAADITLVSSENSSRNIQKKH